MRPHRRTPLAPICFVGILLAGTTLADDDMHNKNAMPSPIGQQPTSTPSAHATDPKSSAPQNTLATPDAMATHMEEMAAMMRQKGKPWRPWADRCRKAACRCINRPWR